MQSLYMYCCLFQRATGISTWLSCSSLLIAMLSLRLALCFPEWTHPIAGPGGISCFPCSVTLLFIVTTCKKRWEVETGNEASCGYVCTADIRLCLHKLASFLVKVCVCLRV